MTPNYKILEAALQDKFVCSRFPNGKYFYGYYVVRQYIITFRRTKRTFSAYLFRRGIWSMPYLTQSTLQKLDMWVDIPELTYTYIKP